MSRLHRVLDVEEGGYVTVEDLDGTRHRVSLLAMDGPAPTPGEWLVVHAGYALDRVDGHEAEAVEAEYRRVALASDASPEEDR